MEQTQRKRQPFQRIWKGDKWTERQVISYEGEVTRFFTNAIKSEISKSKIATLPEPTNVDEQCQVSVQEPPTKVVQVEPHSIVDSGK